MDHPARCATRSPAMKMQYALLVLWLVMVSVVLEVSELARVGSAKLCEYWQKAALRRLWVKLCMLASFTACLLRVYATRACMIYMRHVDDDACRFADRCIPVAALTEDDSGSESDSDIVDSGSDGWPDKGGWLHITNAVLKTKSGTHVITNKLCFLCTLQDEIYIADLESVVNCRCSQPGSLLSLALTWTDATGARSAMLDFSSSKVYGDHLRGGRPKAMHFSRVILG